jgi:hypothetical protein
MRVGVDSMIGIRELGGEEKSGRGEQRGKKLRVSESGIRPTLQEYRHNANLFMCYRIAYRTIAIPATYLPPLISQPYNTRTSHHLAFQIPQCRINCYRFSFFPRIIPHWNTLPLDVASAITLESFKMKLSDHGKK